MVLGEGSSSSKRMKAIQNENIPKNQLSALIVDDDPIIRKIHSALLKSLGLKSQLAENGKEAVDLYHSGANFDIVFIDMEMPVMNGIQATKELRTMGVKSKIVGVTSRCTESEKEEFMLAGLDLFYAKPLTAANVTPLLKELKN